MSTDKTVWPPQWLGGDGPLARPTDEASRCAIADRSVVERAVIKRAAEALRPLLDPADGEVLADYRKLQLRTSSGSMIISLQRLFDQLAEVAAPRWQAPIERFVAAAVAGQQTIQKLRLHDWGAVADQLMIRLIPSHAAGPIGRSIGHGLTLDLGIDLDEVIVIPTATHVASWHQPAEILISTARSNSRRKLQPTITSTELGFGFGFGAEAGDLVLHLSLLHGNPWTTGAITDLDRYIRPSITPRAAGTEHRRFVSALSPTTLAVFESASARQTVVKSNQTALRSAAEQVVSRWFDRALPPPSSPSPDLSSYNLFEVRGSNQTRDQIQAIYPAAVPDGD